MTEYNPGGNALDPPAMTDEERLAKRRFQAGFAFEMMQYDLPKRLAGFAADMKAEGIHVGLGKEPVCCACGEPWPCDQSGVK